MRTHLVVALGFSLSLAATLAQAQSGPAFVRDHVYGPGGRVVMTAEPDTYAPSTPPNVTAWFTPSICEIDITWNASTDIGSGVSGYNVYRDSTYLGNTNGTDWQDTSMTPPGTYRYHVYAYDVAGNLSNAGTGSVTAGRCLHSMSLPPKPSRPAGPAAAKEARSGLLAYLRSLQDQGKLSLVRPGFAAAGRGPLGPADANRECTQPPDSAALVSAGRAAIRPSRCGTGSSAGGSR